MLKIIQIKILEALILVCEFNNGQKRIINVEALIEKHGDLDGIDQLRSFDNFRKVQIGNIGEVLWKRLIRSKGKGQKDLWDYDLSPEFVYHNGSEL